MKHPWKAIPPVTDIPPTLSAGMRSAARPLRVLELFDEIRRPARALEISDRLDLPQSTTSLLLKGMVTLGYLDYDQGQRTYQPCLRVTLLGSWRDPARAHTGALITMLERLSERTGCSASLSSQDGIYLRYVHIVQHEGPGRPHMALSARRYAVWSTSGMSLLATAPEPEVRLLLRRTLAQNEPRAKAIRPDRVFEMLTLARSQGYFAETGLVTPGMRSISIRVPAEISGRDNALALTLSNTRCTADFSDGLLAEIMNDGLNGLNRV